ncbi:hypothetical protein SePPVgORF105 [Seal parapoxvirus]|uniref:Uncharacterized protein n=1 Tax=Seal parapoxvirus TaxID=187984 RepID=A0A1Z3GCQ1_9POXV|nr:hypothetical protein CGV03_gp105 [Seal parapoxvirus]ASC55533.1 hypothetical protein SePPVgORF105 [Seal parapoxvirus]
MIRVIVFVLLLRAPVLSRRVFRGEKECTPERSIGEPPSKHLCTSFGGRCCVRQSESAQNAQLLQEKLQEHCCYASVRTKVLEAKKRRRSRKGEKLCAQHNYCLAAAALIAAAVTCWRALAGEDVHANAVERTLAKFAMISLFL